MQPKDINLLKVNDIYSLMMFAIYKLKDEPEYSTLSELSYVLKKDSLLNFLEYFGGTTIRVPTMSEFKIVIKALLLYQYVKVDGFTFNKALSLIDLEELRAKDVKKTFVLIVDILDKYDFRRQDV